MLACKNTEGLSDRDPEGSAHLLPRVGVPHPGETLALAIPRPTHLLPVRSWRWVRLLRTVRRLARTWKARGDWGQPDHPGTPTPVLGAWPCPLLTGVWGQHLPGQTA